MVEVFRTNVIDPSDATYIISQIRKKFSTYKVNFDLDDCDNILRVESPGSNNIATGELIKLVHKMGYQMEILPE